MAPAFTNTNPAPNVIDWAVHDHEALEAEKAGGLFEFKPWIGETPLWVYNTAPEEMMKMPDSTLLADWGGGPGTAGGHYPSRSLTLDQRSQLDSDFFGR